MFVLRLSVTMLPSSAGHKGSCDPGMGWWEVQLHLGQRLGPGITFCGCVTAATECVVLYL